MKSIPERFSSTSKKSLPVRGAWVEIAGDTEAVRVANGRSPCGERGLKLRVGQRVVIRLGVAPRAGSVG